MIRPVTLITALLAAGSGLYLYHAKYRTQLLDNRIAKVQVQIRSDKARIGVLRAEWALENAPSRLAELATRYLTLQPMRPSQAIRMADLDDRLPPPVPSGGMPGQPGAAPPSPVVAEMPPLAAYAGLAMLSSGPKSVPGPTADAVAALEHSGPERLAAASSVTPPVAEGRTEPAGSAEVARTTVVAKVAAPGESVASEGRAPAPSPMRPVREARRQAPRQAPAQPPVRPVALHVAATQRAATISSPPVTRAAPDRTGTIGTPPPILASALGGQYPDMPPPAPLGAAVAAAAPR